MEERLEKSPRTNLFLNKVSAVVFRYSSRCRDIRGYETFADYQRLNSKDPFAPAQQVVISMIFAHGFYKLDFESACAINEAIWRHRDPKFDIYVYAAMAILMAELTTVKTTPELLEGFCIVRCFLKKHISTLSTLLTSYSILCSLAII